MEQAEIRMLGPLQVRRADGSVIDQGQWRCSKNVDLVRMLAADVGRPVPLSSLVSRLWPDADEEHAGGSLRTAMSQVRKLLGPESLERRQGALVLRHAWVDLQAYAVLLDEAAAARRTQEHERTVALVREAEALYVGDVDVAESSGSWLHELRQHWRERRCQALVDAADAAAALCSMRDSLELAETAFTLDRHSEQAARSLMRALAGLGETRRALRVYEKVRRGLAADFGVDPSPQTTAVHLQLVTERAEDVAGAGPLGHLRPVQELAAALSRARIAQGGVVWLCGPAGSGRDTVTEAACERLGLTLRNLNR
ncbi:MAG: hypothetical protein HOQ22_03760, partial [Nocardioidaceae bacterium]|nr:hypothetical protein [Nocardioidaceae bacterium]